MIWLRLPPSSFVQTRSTGPASMLLPRALSMRPITATCERQQHRRRGGFSRVAPIVLIAEAGYAAFTPSRLRGHVETRSRAELSLPPRGGVDRSLRRIDPTDGNYT